MPITKSALKKQRVDKKRTGVNRVVRSKTKSAVKAALSSPNEASLREMYKALDRAVKSKVIPKNRAARTKARMLARTKAAGMENFFGKNKKPAGK